MQSYLESLKTELGYRATWAPNRTMNLGDIGRFHDGSFVPYTSLKRLGIHQEENENPDSEIDFTSNSEIEVKIKLGASTNEKFKVLGEADFGFEVNFGTQRGILVRSTGVTHRAIANIGEIQEEVLRLRKRGDWDDDYAIVDEVQVADSCTVLISEGKNSSISIKATAAAGIPKLNIGDAKLGLSIVSEKALTTKIVGNLNMTPLYNVVSLKGEGLFNRRFRLSRSVGAVLPLLKVPYTGKQEFRHS